MTKFAFSTIVVVILGLTSVTGSAFTQTTHATGAVDLPIDAHFDLDAGAQSDRLQSDFRYVRSSRGDGVFLWPLNGAALLPVDTNRQLHETCSVDLGEMIQTRIAMSGLREGQYVCARTSEGRVGVLRINEPPSRTPNTLSFGFTVWSNVSSNLPDGTLGRAPQPQTPPDDTPVAGDPTAQPAPTGSGSPVPGAGNPTAGRLPTSPVGGMSTPTAGQIDNTTLLSCPTTAEVRSSLGLTRGTTQSGWDFEIEYPSGCGNSGFCNGSQVVFEGARIENNQLVCEYSNHMRVLVEHDVLINANDRSWLLRYHGAEMSLAQGTGGQCMAESGFDTDGVCRGAGLDPGYCPGDYGYFSNGDCTAYYERPELCQARCTLPPQVNLGQN